MTWLLPILGLIAGLLLLAYAVLAYRGVALVRGVPATFRRPGDLLWLAALALLALALGGGVAGVLLGANLTVLRVLMAATSLVVLVLAWPPVAPPAPPESPLPA